MTEFVTPDKKPSYGLLLAADRLTELTFFAHQLQVIRSGGSDFGGSGLMRSAGLVLQGWRVLAIPVPQTSMLVCVGVRWR